MSWVKVDDKAWCHPKFAELPAGAVRLWLFALCWSNQQETDGAIPKAVLRILGGAPKDASALVAASLWLATDGGWSIHDFLKYQPSKASRDAQRNATAQRVRRHRGGGSNDPPDSDVTPLHERVKRDCTGPRAIGPSPGSGSGDSLEGGAGGNPIRSLDPAEPIELPPDWDPGPEVLHMTPADGKHTEMLPRFVAFHARSGGKKRFSQWVQSYRLWATKDAQEAKGRPPRASLRQTPTQPNYGVQIDAEEFS